MRLILSPAKLSAPFLAALAMVSASHAQTLIDATDPATIMEIARGFGSAVLERDEDGDPMITGRIDGVRYAIVFYGCTEAANCTAIQFLAAWTNPGDVTLEAINAWNLNRAFGRGYLDEQNDPILDYVINLDGGVTIRNLDDSFEWWRAIVAEFAEELDPEPRPE